MVRWARPENANEVTSHEQRARLHRASVSLRTMPRALFPSTFEDILGANAMLNCGDYNVSKLQAGKARDRNGTSHVPQ